jgi:hypothetical protein
MINNIIYDLNKKLVKMHSYFDDVIKHFQHSNKVYKLIKIDEPVCVSDLSQECTKISNSNYSLYFQDNKLEMITVNTDTPKKVFTTLDDAINVLFTTTNF